MKHLGSCHCGGVAFTVDGSIETALACNCSMCQRRGSLLWFVGPEAMQLNTPDGNAASYRFNRHVINHRFCATCGIHTHGEGVDPAGNRVVAINLRCLEGIELEAIPVHHYDGRSR
jgi:hypothetical protein